MKKHLSKLYLLLLHARYWQLQDLNVPVFLLLCTRWMLHSLNILKVLFAKVKFHHIKVCGIGLGWAVLKVEDLSNIAEGISFPLILSCMAIRLNHIIWISSTLGVFGENSKKTRNWCFLRRIETTSGYLNLYCIFIVLGVILGMP